MLAINSEPDETPWLDNIMNYAWQFCYQFYLHPVDDDDDGCACIALLNMGQPIIEYGSAIDKYVCKDDTLKKVDIKSVIFTIRTQVLTTRCKSAYQKKRCCKVKPI